MEALETFITDTLGLTKFPPYLPTFLYSFLGFTFLHKVLAPWASDRFFPIAYGTKDARAQNNWSIHVVSQVHAVIVVPLSLWAIWNESPGMNRAFGWSHEVGHVYAIACGYFLWDCIDAALCFTNLGFLLHGIACFAIYTLSYKPFVAYYGVRCLLWESSTIFLNIHWFLDKTERTGGKAQLINGLFLLSTFFGVRLIYGGKVSYEFLHTLLQVRDEITWAYLLVYGLGNILLMGLSWFWFYKMISSLRRRFANDPLKEYGKLIPNSRTNGHSGVFHVHPEHGANTGVEYGTQP